MIFNSLHFAVFFIVITTIYYLLPTRFRWQLLLAGSCYFYMAFVPIYILILALTIIIDYFAGICIDKSTGYTRKLYLILSLFANIGVLAIFKYYNFINENLSSLLADFDLVTPFPYLNILLPIGLSFHTFQAMSYTIEVYRGNQKPEHHFGLYALYVMFYPQLVAGPIERPQNVLYQFREKHEFNERNVAEGLKLIVWGLFKKVVIADRFAITVTTVYNDPTNYEGLPLIIATVLFAFQIYCDFSGYSDIALGTAQTLGFRLMKNFNRPYLAKTPAEFWTRWHISLSTWFRDYVYIPLGGNRVSKFRWYSNLFITFLLSGLWHGANWTYVVWGSLNGVFLIGEYSTKAIRVSINRIIGIQTLPALKKIIKVLKVICTFCLICLTWIFFRARNLSDAYYVMTHLFTNFATSISHSKPSNLGSTLYDWTIGFLCLFILIVIEYSQEHISIRDRLMNWPALIRQSLYFILVMVILLFGMFDAQEQFIYFQF